MSLNDFYLKESLLKNNRTTNHPPMKDFPFFNSYRKFFENFFSIKDNIFSLNLLKITGCLSSARLIVDSYCSENNIPIFYANIYSKKDIQQIYADCKVLSKSCIFIYKIKEDDVIHIINILYEIFYNKREIYLIIFNMDLFDSYSPYEINIDRFSMSDLNMCIKYYNSDYSINQLRIYNIYTVIHYILNKNLPVSERVEKRVGGMKRLKKLFYRLFILPLEKPELQKIFRPPALLLHGPPGTGKTLIARELANIGHFHFIAINGPELLCKYVGSTEEKLRDIFKRATENRPSLLFFDELDSLMMNRNSSNDFNNRIVNQLLLLMDGVEERNGIYIVGATNRLELIDRALLRPGRFDFIEEVKLPTFDERLEIFDISFQSISRGKIDFAKYNTEGFSGAEIYGMVQESIYCAVERDSTNIIILEEDIESGYKKILKINF